MKNNNMNETDVNVSNNIFRMYMSDAQYERLADANEKKKETEISEEEYWRLKRKLY